MKLSPFWRGFVFLLAATLVVGGLVFSNRILAGDAFEKEEAQHALYGFWLWRDMHNLDWGAFLHDTERQMFWPFLHSWVLSVFFLVFGVGYVSARSLSLVLFVLSILMVYLLSSRMGERSRPKIGVIAGLLMLTSPMMLKYASLSMLEGLGAFLFVWSAYLYLRAEERKDLLHYLLLAFIIGLSLYTNYLYAFLLIPAFLVATAADLGPIFYKALLLRRKGEEAALRFTWWGYRKLISLGVVLALSGVWFSFSFYRKATFFLDAIFRDWGGEILAGPWEALAYYPGVIIQNASFSPWLGGLIVVSLLLPFIAVYYQGLNKIYIFVWTVLVLATFFVATKTPGMIYIIFPFLFILFAAAAVYFHEIISRKNKRLGTAFVLAIALPALISLPGIYNAYFPSKPGENMVQVLEYFRASVPHDKSIAISLNHKNLNPEGVQFHFRDKMERVHAEPGRAEGPVKTDEERYYLTIDLDDNSFYNEGVMDDSVYRWNAFIWSGEMNGELRFYSSRRFDAIGLTAKIFKSTP